MKDYLFTACWAVFVWLFATLFFKILGEHVLFSPDSSQFTISLFLLLAGTAILLFGVTYLYLLFDKAKNAPLKFGIVGTIIGLALDTFSLSYHHLVFPKLDDTQIIAFAAWMSFAYALYLFIPFTFHKKINIK